MLDGGAKGMKIALVKEGFGRPESEKAVDEKVQQRRGAVQEAGRHGGRGVDPDAPASGPAIWTPIGVEGITQTMMFGDGYGLSRPDLYVTSLIDKLHGWQLRANELSETTKLITTLGVYIKKYHGSRYYGKAMNVTRRLDRGLRRVLKQYDLLLMPTLPMKPTPLPPRRRAARALRPARAGDDRQHRALRHHAITRR